MEGKSRTHLGNAGEYISRSKLRTDKYGTRPFGRKRLAAAQAGQKRLQAFDRLECPRQEQVVSRSLEHPEF